MPFQSNEYGYSLLLIQEFRRPAPDRPDAREPGIEHLLHPTGKDTCPGRQARVGRIEHPQRQLATASTLFLNLSGSLSLTSDSRPVW